MWRASDPGIAVALDPLLGTRSVPTESIAELFARHHRRLMGLAAAVTLDRSIADEIVQEAFAGLTSRIAHVRDPDAYLQRSVINLGIAVVRRRERARSAPYVRVEHVGIPEVDGLWDIVASLPAQRRARIVSRVWEDLTQQQVRVCAQHATWLGQVDPAPSAPRLETTTRYRGREPMNELLELERELGPPVAARFRTAIIPTDEARFADQRDAVSTTDATTDEVALTDESHSLTTRSIRRRMLGVAAAIVVVLAGGVALSGRDASPATDPGNNSSSTDAGPPAWYGLIAPSLPERFSIRRAHVHDR